VDNGVTTGEGWPERFRLAEVAHVRFAGNALKVGKFAGFADQHAQIGALGGQRARHMMAHKPRRACQEDFHSD
jgi:hypothetical protein